MQLLPCGVERRVRLPRCTIPTLLEVFWFAVVEEVAESLLWEDSKISSAQKCCGICSNKETAMHNKWTQDHKGEV